MVPEFPFLVSVLGSFQDVPGLYKPMVVSTCLDALGNCWTAQRQDVRGRRHQLDPFEGRRKQKDLKDREAKKPKSAQLRLAMLRLAT